jgi:hypothetical protein
MSNYTKSTNFATKDTLPTGDSGKIVKGTEIDSEFNAIASAVSSKADTASPTFTGTPLAPTAASGTNTTQLATTAFVTGAVTASASSTETLTNKTLTSPTINTPTISGGAITGITDLAVADGGTGVSTIPANAVVLGNGTSAIQTVAPGTSGNLLTSNGTTWTSAAAPTPFSWNVTYVNTAKDDDTSYTLPSNCIGVYIWCKTYGGANNGGIGKVTINNGGTELGYIYVGGTNIGGGADGGSGMTDGVGTFKPVPSAATAIGFSTITNDVDSIWEVQAYVTKA